MGVFLMSRFSFFTFCAVLVLSCTTSSIQSISQDLSPEAMQQLALAQTAGLAVNFFAIPRIEHLGIVTQQNWFTRACIGFMLRFMNNKTVDALSPLPHDSSLVLASRTAIGLIMSLIEAQLMQKLSTRYKTVNYLVSYLILPQINNFITNKILQMLQRKSPTLPAGIPVTIISHARQST
jgi:hypothetical protein